MRSRLYCFEPIPHVAKQLAEYLHHCKTLDRCTINPAPLLDRVTRVEFAVDQENLALSRIVTQLETTTVNKAHGKYNKLSLTTTTLDREVNAAVDVIKLDLEGAEFPALQGATSLIFDPNNPLIILEYGAAWSASKFGYTFEQFKVFFDRFGYEVMDIHGTALTSADATVAFELVAVPRPQAAEVRAHLERFWGAAVRIRVYTEWSECVSLCMTPDLIYAQRPMTLLPITGEFTDAHSRIQESFPVQE